MTNLAEKRSNNYFDGIPVKGRQFTLFLIIVFAYFVEMIDANNFAFIAPALIKDWGIESAVIGQISSIYFMGNAVGGLIGGLLADFIGRRKTFLFTLFIVPASSILNGMATNVTFFMLTRFLTGVGVICMVTVAVVYMAEMTPAESRGKWYSMTAAVGFLAARFIGILSRIIIPTAPDAWRIILYLGGVGLLVWLAGMKYLLESPRWLVKRGRVAEAEKIIHELTGVEVDLSEAIAKDTAKRVNAREILAGMVSRKHLKKTLMLLVIVSLVGCASFVGNIWIPTIMGQKGFTLSQSLTIGTLSFFGLPFGLFISALISDRGGRKIPIAIMAILGAIFAVIFGNLGNNFYACASVAFLFATCMMGVGYMLNMYVGESFPTQMRGAATGYLNFLQRIAISGSQMLIPLILVAYKPQGLFFTVGALLTTAALIILIFGEATGKKSLEEISAD